MLETSKRFIKKILPNVSHGCKIHTMWVLCVLHPRETFNKSFKSLELLGKKIVYLK